MKFNPHLELIGKHAILSPSQYHWINDDKEKLISRVNNLKAKELGTALHAYAADAIRFKRRQQDLDSLGMYVNDAIGYKMTPEQPLVYEKDICFGTADAISFYRKKLRIHDLKTGVTPAHMEQLQLYAALFCLEYQIKPRDIKIELRLYQSNDVIVDIPEADKIQSFMDIIVTDTDIVREVLESGE